MRGSQRNHDTDAAVQSRVFRCSSRNQPPHGVPKKHRSWLRSAGLGTIVLMLSPAANTATEQSLRHSLHGIIKLIHSQRPTQNTAIRIEIECIEAEARLNPATLCSRGGSIKNCRCHRPYLLIAAIVSREEEDGDAV